MLSLGLGLGLNKKNKFASIPILDEFSLDVVFALDANYKLLSDSPDPISIRRSSDNAEQDIPFAGNEIDTSNSHFDGSNYYVTDFYNQKNDGNKATEVTTTDQLEYVLSGGLNNKAYFKNTTGVTKQLQYPFDSAIDITTTEFTLILIKNNELGTYIPFNGASQGAYVCNIREDSFITRLNSFQNFQSTVTFNPAGGVFIMTRVGNIINYYVDNVLIDSLDLGSALTYITFVNLIGSIINNQEFSHLSLFSRPLLESERQTITDYFVARYSTPIFAVLAMGQSNMLGGFDLLSPITSLPADLQDAFDDVYTYTPTLGVGNLDAGVNNQAFNNTQHGIEITLGDRLNTQRGEPIFIFKKSQSATGFVEADTPSNWRVDDKGDNNLLQQAYNELTDAKGKVQELGYRLNIKALVWYQGERDGVTSEATANAWRTQFEALVTDLKSNFTVSSDFTTIIVKIHDINTWDSIVRTAQEALASEDADFHIVDTDAYEPTELHLTSASYQSIGIDVANKINTIL